MLRADTSQEKTAREPGKDEAASHTRASRHALPAPEGMPPGELFGAIMNSSPIGMYIAQDGKFQFVSRKFAEILGYRQDELIGNKALDYVYPEDRDMVRTKAKETLKSGHCQPYEYRVTTKTGEFKWILETVISINYLGKRATLGNFMDITERKLAQEEMRQTNEKLTLMIKKLETLRESLSQQSIQDPLSGLYNRRYMEEALEHEIQRAIRKHSLIGMVMADVDHFKQFNDTYGHAAGDMVIRQVGKLFKQGIRGTDIACRYGGEEFILIFPDCSLEDTLRRAEYLREELKKLEIIFQGQLLGALTISMGVVTYPDHGVTMNDLLRTVDIALYKAKQAGRNRSVCGEPARDKQAIEESGHFTGHGLTLA